MIPIIPVASLPRAPAGAGSGLAAPPPLALYVHWPWCVKKCPYCDFNSHESRGEVDEPAYLAALIADLEAALEQFATMREDITETVTVAFIICFNLDEPFLLQALRSLPWRTRLNNSRGAVPVANWAFFQERGNFF